MPATFTMAPSGARLPFRPTTPPVCDSGLLVGRTTSWSFGKRILRRFSAIVLPVTVMQSPCRYPPSSSARISTGTQPISSRSLATYFPPGFRSAM